jgi:HPt (histidine-containing phosphotransfer) domain-containing protein
MAKSFLILGGNFSERETAFQDLYLKLKPKEARLTNDPDLISVSRENSIGIDQVRRLEENFSLKSHSFPPKLGFIAQAEKLTLEAQNALLKILEEPVGNSVLVLTAPRQENLLTTVVSRCQLINLPEKAAINLGPKEIQELSQELEKILKASPGERIQLNEQLTARDEAITYCQFQLVLWREILLKKIKQPQSLKNRLNRLSFQEMTTTIHQLEKALQYLKANANPRLTLDNLLLSYPVIP